MTFQTTKPAPNDDLDVSVTDIQQNFLVSNTVMDIDHFTFNNLTAQKGYHKKSTYVSNIYTLAAPPVTIAGQVAMYAANTVPGNVLASARDGVGTGTQLTNTLGPVVATNGYSWLPGGVYIQWGIVGPSSASSIPVLFVTSNIDFPSACFNVNVVPIRAATSPGSDFSTCVVTGSVTNTGFTIGNIGGHSVAGWYWTAIGN